MKTKKDFKPLEGLYNFFESSTDEISKNVLAYKKILPGRYPKRTEFCDFGAGEGHFLEALMPELALSPNELGLSLVEINKSYWKSAKKLSKFTDKKLGLATEINYFTGKFDFILSHHAICYVEDLEKAVLSFVKKTKRKGKIIVTIAGQENPLVQLWDFGFSLIGEHHPFYTAENLQDILQKLGLKFVVYKSNPEMKFVDTPENRKKILNFILGETFHKLPVEKALLFFEPYRNKGHIRFTHIDRHYVITV